MSAETALVESIEQLKRDRNAVVLAHYYQEPDVQDIADFIGDSLELSRKAADTDADVIAFCAAVSYDSKMDASLLVRAADVKAHALVERRREDGGVARGGRELAERADSGGEADLSESH